MRFPPFLYIGLFLLAAVHYSLWLRLVREPALPAPWRAVATAVIVLLFLLVPATFYTYRTHVAAAWPFTWPGFVWMGTLAILPLWLAGSEFISLAARLGDALRGNLPDPARRLLLLRTLGIAVAAGSAVTAAVALRQGLRRPMIREVEVPLRRLPHSLDGTTIVQLTDVHVGPTIGRPFMEDLVRRTNALAPDLVAITGDLVDGTVAELAEAVAPLGDLRARWGVYFVTGNHEYYSGIEGWLAHLPSLGVRVLRNERVSIGANGDSFDLAGIEDVSARYYPGHGADLPRALLGRDPGRELLLLAHQPRQVLEAAEHGVGLQLSGHTHGGQIWPWGLLVRLTQPYVAGLVRHGDTHLYISRGSGYWGPPMRLAEPSEITHIRLRAAS